jgi:anti-anti-sigma factor
VDIAAEAEAERAVMAALDAHAARVVIHLGGVTFMDSAGLRVLALGLREARERGIELVIGPSAPIVERVLEISDLRSAADSAVEPSR